MKRRRATIIFIGLTLILAAISSAAPLAFKQGLPMSLNPQNGTSQASADAKAALAELDLIEVKGRAPKSGYSRDEFGDGWSKVNGCSTRDIILYRDLKNVITKDDCTVASGILNDPYTGTVINFTAENSSAVQIDHVVALSDAWQKGAQQLSYEVRVKLANDPLELLAVDGPANQQKGDGDAATWLPKNKPFRCEYIERQIEIKRKYSLWVTEAEKDAMVSVLSAC